MPERKSYSEGWGWRWSPENATLADSLVTREQRQRGWRIRVRGGQCWWRIYGGWIARTCRQLTQDWISHSSRSGNSWTNHPRHRGCLWPSGWHTPRLLPSGPLPGPRGRNTKAEYHLTVGEAGGSGPTRLHKDVPWELESILFHHKTTCCSTQGTGGVPDGGPFHDHLILAEEIFFGWRRHWRTRLMMPLT